MREYENNSSTNNENSENDTALSIATLIINLHTSFHLENFRLIEKYFVSFTKYMEAMALIKFQLNLSIQEDSLFSRSKKSGEVTLHLDSKPKSVFSHTGDFGCGNGGRTPIIKTSPSKVAIYLQRNSLLIQDSGDKRRQQSSRVAELSGLSCFCISSSMTVDVMAPSFSCVGATKFFASW